MAAEARSRCSSSRCCRGAPDPPPRLKFPADLKERINNALAQRHPIMITYVDVAGQPNLTFRGSTQVFSDTQLAIWVRNTSGKMIRSIQKNSKVALKRIQHWCNFLLEHPRTAEGDSRRVLRVQSTSAYPSTFTAKADVPGRSLGHNRKSPARNDMRRLIRFSALPSTANNRSTQPRATPRPTRFLICWAADASNPAQDPLNGGSAATRLTDAASPTPRTQPKEPQCITKLIEGTLGLPLRIHRALLKHVKDVTRIPRQSRSALTDRC
jgi:hypothetical protein